MHERAAQELNPEMGRMGAEDPSTAFPAEPPVGPFTYNPKGAGSSGGRTGPRRIQTGFAAE